MRESEPLFGLHVVREALSARHRKFGRLLVAADHRGAEVERLAALAHEAGVPVEFVSRGEIAQRAGPAARTQGVVLEAGPIPERTLAALRGGERGRRRLVALDGVEDPQNLGAIARVAEAAGVQGLVLTRHRSPPLSAAVARASAGAIEHLPVARVTNLSRALEELQGDGFWTVGADPAEGDDLFSAPERTFQGDLVVVLGAEGKGLRPAVEARLDHRLRIPMEGRIASLNVSAAAAVLLFEILRRSRLWAGHGLP
ncbi:MAG TPA: 23S rRNA (guanosine(2251)-2'-O)-methyltransferase RlmB [Myxococcota bacterium]|nr:23S rRNA (guanosine(2251)-2'-O)-methyltransferase RlmB [Myxococcota bacterium]